MFFVAEVLRHLTESGALERRDGRWALTAAVEDLGIPEGVHDVVGRRLSRLSGDANRVLACAAVVGLEFEPVVVGAAGGFAEDVVLSGLDEAVATRLVVEVPGAAPRNRFSHALVRATLYDELTAARRAALHRRVAEALETVHGKSLDDHLPALAYHWARASSPGADTDRAVDYAARAGDRALAQLAHHEAVTYYHSALELAEAAEGLPDEGRRLELLLRLGEAQRRAGEPAYRETLLAATALAQQRGDSAALVRAALANTRGVWGTTGRVDEERVAALRAALDAVREGAPGTRAQLLARLASETVNTGDDGGCGRLSDEALALARRDGDPATLATVLVARCVTLSGPGAIAARAAAAEELLPMAEALGDPVALCWGLLLRGRSAVEFAQRDEADRCFERLERAARETGQPALRWWDAMYRTGLAVAVGRAGDAERLSRELLELGAATGMPETTGVYALNLMLRRFGDGDPAEAEGPLRQSISDFPGLDMARALVAWLCCELGRLEEGRALLAAGREAGFARPPRNHIFLAAIMAWAAAAARLGEVVSAQALSELARPFPEHVIVVGGVVLGSLSHTRGLLAATVGDADEAVARFAVAEKQHERLGAPAWLTRTRLEWARALLRRAAPGDAARARDLLHGALATTEEFGLRRLREQVEALLARA